MKILYENNHLIAVEKQPGQLTQGDSTKDPSLLDEVKNFIKQRDHKPGRVFIGLLHRLDRPVGGVVLFAKTSKGASRLSAQIRSHRFHKTYTALVEGNPPASGHLVQWLIKDRKRNVVQAYNQPQTGAQQAELTFRRLQVREQQTPLLTKERAGVRWVLPMRGEGKLGASLVEITPLTGRPHQIRVAMASLKTPIVGDFKYGAKQPWHGQIALWATALSFAHPITKESVTVVSPPPFDLSKIK